jgi:Fe-S cluster assembly protein SufD
MPLTAESLDRYVSEYERATPAASATQPFWLTRTRRQAFDRFQRLGLPTTRDEAWRFTSVAPIAERQFALAKEPADPAAVDVTPFQFPSLAPIEIVFLNNRYSAELSTVPPVAQGIRIASLASAMAAEPDLVEQHLAGVAGTERAAFTALNTAFLLDGAFVFIPANVQLDRPIHVLFVTGDTGFAADATQPMSHPRLLVVMEENSRASLMESYAAAWQSAYLTNAVTEIVLGDGAVLDHSRIQRESRHGFHISATHVAAARHSSFTSHSISFGGALVRNETIAVLGGEGGECTLNGLYVGDGRRLVDNHTTIDHASPHCGSREVYKGILTDHARAVFNGKIVVRPDAQKTDAKQTNKALLLSADAQINTKPELEIFANDVRCTHGAAIGQMDEEAIFYLRSRGLGHAEARNVLIHAFAADVINRMPLVPVRETVEAELLRQLHASVSAGL